MGTDVELLVAAVPGPEVSRGLAEAEAEFHRLEQILSRFQPESELSALNRRGRLRASPALREVVELAVQARARTEGRFDPTVHDALVAAGYDRSFEEVPPEGTASAGPSPPCGGRVSLRDGLVVLEPGYRLDLGGIAKGYAVDRACSLLAQAGSCLVNAGGDLAVCGSRSWPIGLETAGTPLTLALERGAIATSGRDRRRWRRSGEERHHLIDPATGRPADVDLRSVTVVAGTAAEAEVLAKVMFLAGSEAASSQADRDGTPCVLVTAECRTILAGGLA